MTSPEQAARRAAVWSMALSGSLAIAKLVAGFIAGSTAVVADGFESLGDVFASGFLVLGLWVAGRPPDDDHPYGHGRFEMLTALALGVFLAMTGVAIALQSLNRLGEIHAPPRAFVVWPVIISIVTKTFMAVVKMRIGRRTRSSALLADAWNDAVDILSGFTALAAVGLTMYDPGRFLAADHWGGFAVGLLVVILGLQVMRETALQLMDTMPDPDRMEQIRRVAKSIPGAMEVEKCFARKTGLRYHVDLHLEVAPDLTVHASHDIATRVRFRIKDELPWVADVLVHVEPFTGPSGGA